MRETQTHQAWNPKVLSLKLSLVVIKYFQALLCYPESQETTELGA